MFDEDLEISERLINPYKLYEKNEPVIPDYRTIEVQLYSYIVPSFAAAMTDGKKVWFAQRDSYFATPDHRLKHELGHHDEWDSPLTTELSVDERAKNDLVYRDNKNVTYIV